MISRLLKTILASGYHGPIGILGHTMDDAEARLRDNLDGLDWLLPQLEGKAPGPPPRPRTPVPARPSPKTSASTKADVRTIAAGLSSEQARELADLVEGARREGDAGRGAEVFLNPRFSLRLVPQGGHRRRCRGPRADDGRPVPFRRGDRRVGALAETNDQGRLSRRSRFPPTTARFVQGYREDETKQTLVVARGDDRLASADSQVGDRRGSCPGLADAGGVGGHDVARRSAGI